MTSKYSHLTRMPANTLGVSPAVPGKDIAKSTFNMNKMVRCRNCGETQLWCKCWDFNVKETREGEIERLIRKYGLSRNGHSHFSPSGSAGWLNCKGFLLANALKPDDGGEDAAYGTVAHAIAAVWLAAIRDEGNRKAEHVPKRFLGHHTTENGFKITCDAEMLHHIRRYIDWCEEVEILGDVFIEQHVGYSEYMPIPKQGGTADHFVCCDPTLDGKGFMVEGGTLIITDLKMGIGIRVYVERNSQAMLYALGVYLEWNWMYSFEKIVIRICQPRVDYFGTWECTVKELLEFAEEARVAAEAAWREDQPRSPSPKACQWCADRDCVAKSALLEDLGDDLFDDDNVIEGILMKEYDAEALDSHAMSPLFGDLPKDKEPRFSRRMSTALKAWRYGHRSMYEKFFREIGEDLLQLALAGEHIPGWKVVDGRRSFKWSDNEYAASQLFGAGLKKKDIFHTEVTSVSEARKALRATGMMPKAIEAFFAETDDSDENELVIVSPGKPTLVPSTDEREDAQDAADDAFDDDEL